MIILFSLSAAHAGSPGGGIDLVLLLDQSGSMSGNPIYHPKPNDPWKKRVEAVHDVVLTLFDAMDGYRDMYGIDLIHRLSIIEFGTKARLVLSARCLDNIPKESDIDRRVRMNSITSSIQARDLGFTDPLAAFIMATREFEEMKRAALPGSRPRCVLLITDGKPYVTGFSESSYLEEMENYLRNNLELLGINIEVIGLNDVDDYWNQGYGDYWKKVSHDNAQLIEGPDNFYEAIKGVLNKYVKGMPTGNRLIRVEGNTFDCPPYLKQIIINIDKHIPGASVSMKDPDGNPVNQFSLKQIDRPTFTRIYIPEPKPGVWTIQRTSVASCSIEIELYYKKINLISPPHTVNPQQHITIRYQVASASDIPFRELPSFPVTVVTEITAPNQETQSIPLSLKQDGIFEANQDLIFTDPGIYTFKMSGSTATQLGKRVTIFESYGEEIEVTNKKPIQLFIGKPGADEIQPLRFGSGKIVVEAKLIPLDNPNSSLPIADVALDPQKLLEVRVTDEKGIVIGDPVPFQFDGRQLVAEVPVKIPLMSLEWIMRKGNYRLVFDVHDAILAKDYYFHSVYREKPL